MSIKIKPLARVALVISNYLTITVIANAVSELSTVLPNSAQVLKITIMVITKNIEAET